MTNSQYLDMGIKERKKRERKRREHEIISAAEAVFSELGFEDATMSDIAQEAELSKGTLYLYFQSKEELHFAVGLKALNMVTEYIAQKISPEKTGMENVQEALPAYLEFSEKYPTHYRAILEFQSSKLEKISAEDKSKIFDKGSPLFLLRDMLSKGVADGSLRSDIDPMQLVAVLWSQLTGLQQFVQYRVKLTELVGLSPESMLEKHLQIITEGIKKR